MAKLPDTNDQKIALLAAALKVADFPDRPQKNTRVFPARLRRVLVAYKVLSQAVGTAELDVDKLMAQVDVLLKDEEQ